MWLSAANKMDLRRGFSLDEPAVTIPWNISEAKLIEIGGRDGLRQVSGGYYVATCKALGGLDLQIGFHFSSPAGGKLRELEFFWRFARPIAESFAEFQKHLEATFGPPTSTEPGSDGFPLCVWRVRGAEVRHCVFDRFGLEEHVRISKR